MNKTYKSVRFHITPTIPKSLWCHSFAEIGMSVRSKINPTSHVHPIPLFDQKIPYDTFVSNSIVKI